MKAPSPLPLLRWAWTCLAAASCVVSTRAQTLINVDFGAGAVSAKVGFAATGQATNDFWNRYRHYEPRFQPGMPLVADGRLAALKFADGTPSAVAITVTNAPGVWGNATGDPMFDSYIFASNGSNITVTLTGLEAGRYHFYLYGYAAADVTGEQTPAFTLQSGTNQFGPAAVSGAANWSAGQPWHERAQFVVFRDVPVSAGEPVAVEVAPGAGGVAVLNGLQILSRGTGPPRLVSPEKATASAGLTNLLFREINYVGQVGTNEARFHVGLDAESRNTNELSAVVFEGDLALLTPKLPDAWRVVNQGQRFVLFAGAPGRHRLEFDVVAKIQRAEPWSQFSFAGPPAAIATVEARASSPDTVLQLLSGTPVEGNPDKTARGVLGSDRLLALRWQTKTAEITRDSVVNVEGQIEVHASPNAIRYRSQFHYHVLQSRLAQLKFALPENQTLTRLQGDGIRDWRIESTNGAQAIIVDLLLPIETNATVTLLSEQMVAGLPATNDLSFPSPLGVQRETGSVTLTTEDVLAQIKTAEGLRQVDAAPRELAAYQFTARPLALRVALTRVEPLIVSTDRVHALIEETRLVIRHELVLNVTRAGLYAVELTPQPGLTVTDLKSDALDEWKLVDGKLKLSFKRAVLGVLTITAQLEQTFTNPPPQVVLLPLLVTGAADESADIGATAAAGIQLKTAALLGAREMPVSSLPQPGDDFLGFHAGASHWQVALAAERLEPRVVAEVFNLITVGDGLVGGSATIRFGIVNQGTQQFRVRTPAHWRNLEFTGPNIRRKDLQDGVWTISLQDKAWDGYTLVVTYDYSFDSKKAALDAAGAHPLDVERETGSVAITTAPNLTLEPPTVTEPLRAIDPSELAGADRSLISRPVLLAYHYEGAQFALPLNVTRHEELAVLDAVADRSQLTTVLTESGEMLTQANFMVKNNERQFQRFELPAGATLWGVTVNGEPVKAERDGGWLLVSLPRGANRDQAFSVDLKYAQDIGAPGGWWPKQVRLAAPRTDVPGTYAEWELYVPTTKHASGFGGNMTVAPGTKYGFRDAWRQFTGVYLDLWHEYGAAAVVITGLAGFALALAIGARRNGARGVTAVAAVFCVLALLGSMMLPALSKAKAKAVRVKSINNLKTIGLAARSYAAEHGGQLPSGIEELAKDVPAVSLVDPDTGGTYTYVGAGKSEANPNGIVAYSDAKEGRRELVLADGAVRDLTESEFADVLAREDRAKRSPTPWSSLASPAQQNEPAAAAAPREPQQIPESRGDRSVLGAFGANRPVTARSAPELDLKLNKPGVFAGGGASGAAEAKPAQLSAATAGKPVMAPTATGVKSLRIEIPKSGQGFSFTRVLNVSGESPNLRLSLMSANAFLLTRTISEVLAFLTGLGMAWFQIRRRAPSSFWLAVGAGLALLAAAHVLIAWRILHQALIFAAPAAALSLAAWWLQRLLTRPTAGGTDAPASGRTGKPILPAVASLLLGLGAVHPVRADQFNGPPPVSIVAATYTGQAGENVAQLEVTYDFVAGATNQSLALFGKEVAVQEFTATAGEARIWREGERVGVLLPERGGATARLKILVKLGGDATRRQLSFGIPAALSSRFSLVLDEPDADIECPSAVSFGSSGQGSKTQVNATLGATERFAASWTPRVKQAPDIAPTVFAELKTLVSVGAGVVNSRSALSWQISQGELRRVRVALPPGERLLNVNGSAVRSWDFADVTHETLVVELLQPATHEVRLAIETERSLGQLPMDLRIAVPRALNVKRRSGSVALRVGDELGLTVARANGLERLENGEFARAWGDDKLAVASAWRFLETGFDLLAQVELLKPRLEAVVNEQFRVGLDQLSVSATVDYSVSRAGVFNLAIALPPGLRVEAVQSGALQAWVERGDETNRWLDLALRQRSLGPVQVTVQLVRAWTNLPPTLELAGVQPLGVEKLSGYVAVTADAGVGLKTAQVTGATEIPAATLANPPAGGAAALAFKYLGAGPQPNPWRLALVTERLEAWVRAEIVTFVTINETLATGRSQVRYDIANAPVKELRLKTPLAWRNVEINGEGVRRRDQTTNGDALDWRVELQSNVRDDYRLEVRWELPRGGTNALTFTGLEALGAERETGALGFFAPGQQQLTTLQKSEQLTAIDPRELPEWATDRPPGVTALNFHYLRPGWRLELEARRFENAALLQALVDRVQLRTVIADDGQFMTQIEISVHNNGRQNLAFTLPPGAAVWSAAVDGQPLRPARRDAQLLVPLERTASDNIPIRVQLTYVGAAPFPHGSGQVELIAPRLDLPLKDAHWEVYLPPNYLYDHFKGSMTFESGDAIPIAQDFTLAEYQRQESAQQDSFQAQAVEFFREAKTEIVNGHSAAGTKLGYFAGNQTLSDNYAAGEFKSLEQELSRAQSSNLIQAQEAYSARNSRQLNGDAGAAVARRGQAATAYDSRVAGRQVAQLQKAQAVAATRVTPLRVSLPTRGLRHSFTQILQTEADKPMTIRFHAVNDRETGWFKTGLLWLAGFLTLWALAALVASRRADANARPLAA